MDQLFILDLQELRDFDLMDDENETYAIPPADVQEIAQKYLGAEVRYKTSL